MFRGLIFAAALSTGAATLPISGLDHMPVAVADLDRAVADFQRLGFVLKPGRPHDDSIRNRHVKFPNGGEIELITASAPMDALARSYVDWIKIADGPAFWSVRSGDFTALISALAAKGLAASRKGELVTMSEDTFPHRLFFGERGLSPTDGPQYWAHPNGAYQLRAVWLAGAAGEKQLLSDLGARPGGAACAPFDAKAEVLTLPEGDQVIFSSAEKRPPEREILGATVLVKSLPAARRVLDANGVRYLSPSTCKSRSLWIRPADAHNLWLELRED
jgi:hypothetical protein